MCIVVKDWKAMQNGQSKLGIHSSFQILSNHYAGENEEKNGKIKIGHSESFWTTLVGKDWKMCRMTKIECSK